MGTWDWDGVRSGGDGWGWVGMGAGNHSCGWDWRLKIPFSPSGFTLGVFWESFDGSSRLLVAFWESFDGSWGFLSSD